MINFKKFTPIFYNIVKIQTIKFSFNFSYLSQPPDNKNISSFSGFSTTARQETELKCPIKTCLQINPATRLVTESSILFSLAPSELSGFSSIFGFECAGSKMRYFSYISSSSLLDFYIKTFFIQDVWRSRIKINFTIVRALKVGSGYPPGC